MIGTAVGAAVGSCPGGQCIGAGAGLGQAIGGLACAGSHAREVFLLLFFRAEVEDGQHADADVRGECRVERAAGLAEFFTHQRVGVGVERRAAVLFRDVRAEQAESACFLHERHLVVERMGAVAHLLHEILAQLPDHAVFLAEILGDEHIGRFRFADNEFATAQCLGVVHGRVLLPLPKVRGCTDVTTDARQFFFAGGENVIV